MNIFKKLFIPKKTSAEAGHELWLLCERITAYQLDNFYPDLRDSLGIVVDVEKAIVEKYEATILNMWAMTKSLSGSGVDDVIRSMWLSYVSSCVDLDANDVQSHLLSRCDQYESFFDHKNGQHSVLAVHILMNLYIEGKNDKKFLDIFIGYQLVAEFYSVMSLASDYLSNTKIVN